MKPFIEFKDFSFQYEAQSEPTLKKITLHIEKGQKVLIIGPSGSGKSTLAQCLNGIIPNTFRGQHSGSLRIDGKEMYESSIYEKSQMVSTVLQDPDGQFIGLTVAEDLAFVLENDCVSHQEMKSQVSKWSEQLQLDDLLKHRPQDLSGGQKQRVSLAGVLIDESPILLFDEPLANLDPKTGQDIIDLIDVIHQTDDVTTIIIEHRLEDVLYRKVDIIVLMNEGKIVFSGSPDDLLSTTLLQDNGIREPLYLSFLKNIGISLDGVTNLSNLEQMSLEEVDFTYDRPPKHQVTNEKCLEVSHLTYEYQIGEPILKDISISIRKGERLAIVGQNGAGKSTFAKSLSGMIEAKGDIFYNGQKINGDSIKERAEKIGYVLQNPNHMISQAMIYDEIALGLRYRGVPETKIDEKVNHILKVCGLYSYRKWPISALSFGQKKRVTIASVLVLEPEILILDEPTAGQDEKNYTEMMTFLNHLNSLGHTIIMVTHDMQLLLEYTDRVLVFSKGRIIEDTLSEKLFSQENILQIANLKKTSLYELAEKYNLDPLSVTRFYNDEKRRRYDESSDRLS